MYYLIFSVVHPIWSYGHKIEIKAYLLTYLLTYKNHATSSFWADCNAA